MPKPTSKKILWRAPARAVVHKTADWYWIFGIIGMACAGAFIIIGNVLFGIVVILGLFTTTLLSFKRPPIVEVEIQEKGIRTDSTFLPFTTIEGFCIEETVSQKKLLLKSKKLFMPLIVLPIGIVDIEELKSELSKNIKEELIEESTLVKLLERLGI